MKAISSKAALAALLIGTAVTAVQADPSRWPWPEEQPQLMLAESGSDRVMDYQERQVLLNQQRRQDSGERFVQMIKEQPTAVGNTTDEPSDKMSEPKPMLKSPIQRDRELYGK